MAVIDRISATHRIAAEPIAAASRPDTSRPAASTDSALLSVSPLRTAVTPAHTSIDRLQDLSRFVDSAGGALESVQLLLQEGTRRITDGEPGPVDMLDRIDRSARSPRLAGEPALAEGVTLRAGSREVDIRPISSLDLGAVVENGRSHRLADVRSGGSLDPLGNRSGALKSIAAAMHEVADVQSTIRMYRNQVLEPMHRASLHNLATATRSERISSGDAANLASEVRSRLFSGEALAGVQPDHAIALLSLRRL